MSGLFQGEEDENDDEMIKKNVCCIQEGAAHACRKVQLLFAIISKAERGRKKSLNHIVLYNHQSVHSNH